MVKVGKPPVGRKSFLVHEGLLREYSDYFKNRMNGHWGDTKVIEIEDEPEIFCLFSDFMYRGRLLRPPANASDAQDDTEPAKKKRRTETKARHHDGKTLAQLYVFAELRQSHQLKCAVVDAFLERHHDIKVLPFAAVPFIYSNTPAGCGMRRLLVDLTAKCQQSHYDQLSKNIVILQNSHVEPEYLADLVIALCKARDNKEGSKKLKILDYHDCEKQFHKVSFIPQLVAESSSSSDYESSDDSSDS